MSDDRQMQSKFDEFVGLHYAQFVCSEIPEKYWFALFEKLSNTLFDAGEWFQIIDIEGTHDDSLVEEANDSRRIKHEWKVIASQDISLENNSCIFLIDHMWTFRYRDARSILNSSPGLVKRLSNLMFLDSGNENTEVDTTADEVEIEEAQSEVQMTSDGTVDKILVEMWKFIQTYNLKGLQQGIEEEMPVWYFMDEFGSRIQHSDSPNCRCVPFYFVPADLSFTLLFPISDIEEDEEVSRDFIESGRIGDSKPLDQSICRCRFLPWSQQQEKDSSYPDNHDDQFDIDFHHSEPDSTYFQSFCESEIFGDVSKPADVVKKPVMPTDRKIRVYTDHDHIIRGLRDERFELIDNQSTADIIWLRKHFKDFSALRENQPNTFINQFPFENVLTVKDLFAVTCRRAAATEGVPRPPWLCEIYNLQTELAKFVSYFRHREKRGVNNVWICKPWNLTHGFDIYVGDNLSTIIRVIESGPKVACKYVSDPVLFYRDDISCKVKFDVSFSVLLYSIQPLVIYVSDRFGVRLANKEFSLDQFDDYEKHFTVMNYTGPSIDMKNVTCYEWIKNFDNQYPEHPWSTIQTKINQCIGEMFKCATVCEPPKGISDNKQSRALYSVDVILQWVDNGSGSGSGPGGAGQTSTMKGPEIQPVILEVNFSPDSTRSMVWSKDYYNEIFSCLFLDQMLPNSPFRLVS